MMRKSRQVALFWLILASLSLLCLTGCGSNQPDRVDERAVAIEIIATNTPVLTSSAIPTSEPTAISTDTRVPTNTPLPIDTPTAVPTADLLPPPTDTPLPVLGQADPASNNFVEAQVVNIVDGDTIDVLIGGTSYRVRYILIDTPEVSGGVEPFGPEATEANRALVEGQRVVLEKDVSETDRYGRLLRYVHVGQGRHA
jgi:micrococcal nuclease